ncbi:MAG: hypothetical protein V3V00_09775 [Saprospiraceae bacterium]
MRIWMLGIVLVLFSCNTKEQSKIDSTVTLDGRWLMEAAARDGKLTETLKGSFFEFHKDNQLINNLNRKVRTYSYELVSDVIKQRGGDMDVDYQIVQLVEDTLILRTRVLEYDFQFLLLKDTSKILN